MNNCTKLSHKTEILNFLGREMEFFVYRAADSKCKSINRLLFTRNWWETFVRIISVMIFPSIVATMHMMRRNTARALRSSISFPVYSLMLGLLDCKELKWFAFSFISVLSPLFFVTSSSKSARKADVKSCASFQIHRHVPSVFFSFSGVTKDNKSGMSSSSICSWSKQKFFPHSPFSDHNISRCSRFDVGFS